MASSALPGNRQTAQIREGAYTAFVNGSYQSNLAYRPQFVSNDRERGVKERILTTDYLTFPSSTIMAKNCPSSISNWNSKRPCATTITTTSSQGKRHTPSRAPSWALADLRL